MTKRYLTPADMAQLQQVQTPASSSSRGARKGSRDRDTVHSITAAPEALSVDMGRRMKVYGVQMFLRVACFFGFVLVDNLWLRVACVIGMVILPWSAVLLANAGADKSDRASSYLGPELNPELTAAPTASTAADSDDDAASPTSGQRSAPGGSQEYQHTVHAQHGDGEAADNTVVEGEWS